MENHEETRAIRVGSTCLVTQDIYIDQTIAFAKGDSVIVKALQPDVERPEFMYDVYSASLKRDFLLRDVDLVVWEPRTSYGSQVVAHAKNGSALHTWVTGIVAILWLTMIILLSFPVSKFAMILIGDAGWNDGPTGFKYMLLPRSGMVGWQGFTMAWTTVVVGVLAMVALGYMVVKGRNKVLSILVLSASCLEVAAIAILLLGIKSMGIEGLHLRATTVLYLIGVTAILTLALSIFLLILTIRRPLWNEFANPGA